MGNFTWTSESSRIAAHYFPFNGVSSGQPIIQSQDALQQVLHCSTENCLKNKPYNKGFVGGFIEGEFAKEGNMFRCDVKTPRSTDSRDSMRTRKPTSGNLDLALWSLA